MESCQSDLPWAILPDSQHFSLLPLEVCNKEDCNSWREAQFQLRSKNSLWHIYRPLLSMYACSFREDKTHYMLEIKESSTRQQHNVSFLKSKAKPLLRRRILEQLSSNPLTLSHNRQSTQRCHQHWGKNIFRIRILVSFYSDFINREQNLITSFSSTLVVNNKIELPSYKPNEIECFQLKQCTFINCIRSYKWWSLLKFQYTDINIRGNYPIILAYRKQFRAIYMRQFNWNFSAFVLSKLYMHTNIYVYNYYLFLT